MVDFISGKLSDNIEFCSIDALMSRLMRRMSLSYHSRSQWAANGMAFKPSLYHSGFPPLTVDLRSTEIYYVVVACCAVGCRYYSEPVTASGQCASRISVAVEIFPYPYG